MSVEHAVLCEKLLAQAEVHTFVFRCPEHQYNTTLFWIDWNPRTTLGLTTDGAREMTDPAWRTGADVLQLRRADRDGEEAGPAYAAALECLWVRGRDARDRGRAVTGLPP